MQGCFLFLIGWCIKEYWLIDAQCQDASRSSVKRHHEMQWRKAAGKSLVRRMVTFVISRLWCRWWCGLQWVEGGVWYWWSVGGETGFSAAAKLPLECTLIFLRWIHLFRSNLIWSKIFAALWLHYRGWSIFNFWREIRRRQIMKSMCLHSL